MRTVIVLFIITGLSARAQGPLTPPGAPAPIMKTLDQVEPRTPVSGIMNITRSGSYYLTTNIIASAAGTQITITTNNVTLDLNGFTIVGTGGSGSAVQVSGARTNIVVRNGSVRGFGGDGISAVNARFGQFENLILTGNGGDGLSVGDRSKVVACVAQHNSGDGISIGSESQVLQCTASSNSTSGIVVGTRSKIAQCFAVRNSLHGIQLSSTICTVEDSLANLNVGSGIFSLSGGHIVRNCKAEDNDGRGIDLGACCNVVIGCFTGENGLDGIRVSASATVSDNVSRFNGSSTNNGAGIRLVGADNHVEHNRTFLNDLGVAAFSSDNLIIRNSAYSNQTNYFTIGSQNIGPIITTPGTITNANPWANFSY